MRGGIQVGPPGVTRTSGPRLATLAPVRLGGPMIRFNAVGMPLKILCGAALVPHQTKLNLRGHLSPRAPEPASKPARETARGRERWRLRQSNQQRFHLRAGNRVGVEVLSCGIGSEDRSCEVGHGWDRLPETRTTGRVRRPAHTGNAR